MYKDVSYPNEAINAGTATIIKPTDAVAASRDVVTPKYQLN